MTTNITIALDTRYKKKDGTYPIVLRMSRDERTLAIPTEYSIPEKDWDAKKREVKKSFTGVSSVTRLNNLLAAQRKNARDIILKLEEAGKIETMSLADIKASIIQKSTSSSFITFADEEIAALNKAKRFGTARWYSCTLSVLKDHINGKDRTQNTGKSKGNGPDQYNGKDLRFQDITYKFLMNFETEHYNDGNTANGLSFYMRAIRAIYNKGMKAGLVDKELYPFNDYHIKSEPTAKRALDVEPLNQILALEIGPEHECFHARNYFVASYMIYGMSFSDMAYLQKTDMVGGRISYRRRKTAKIYDIKITPALNNILSYYIAQSGDSPFVFPILKQEDALQQDKEVQWARKRYNKKLKALAQLCGIEQNLTSYVSRHSFATQAMHATVPIAAISAMLGHSSIKTTEIYLKGLPSNVLDDYNSQIMGQQPKPTL